MSNSRAPPFVPRVGFELLLARSSAERARFGGATRPRSAARAGKRDARRARLARAQRILRRRCDRHEGRVAACDRVLRRARQRLEHLTALANDAFRVLGITSADISTTKGNVADWGILGLASIDGRACVLSSFRCYRSARDSRHATARLGKTAVHELGHTLGLEHCPSRGCLMQDGGGTVLTTDGEHDLCSVCRGKLSAAGFLRADAHSPWA